MEVNDGDSFAVAYPFGLGMRHLITINNRTRTNTGSEKQTSPKTSQII